MEFRFVAAPALLLLLASCQTFSSHTREQISAQPAPAAASPEVAADAAPAWTQLLSEHFDERVPPILARGHIPGAVILVGHRENGHWVNWSRAYGDIQVSPEGTVRPMPEDAVFDLASMTKPIATGTSLMICQDRGLLSVDDPVCNYLPEYNTPEKRNVRIRDLMTHSSGLPSYVSQGQRDEIEAHAGYPSPFSLRYAILNMPLEHPARTTMVYSCLNAITTAAIVQRVSGQPLDQFAHDNIFAPLGMNDTAFSPGPGPRVVPTTKGEHSNGEFLCGMVHDPLANIQAGVSGNAGLFSTAQDLATFAQMMLDGGEHNGVRILSQEAIAQATQDQLAGTEVRTPRGGISHRGLLWEMYEPTPGDRGIETIEAFGHTGYTGTAFRMWPSQDLYVIALTNRVHPDDSAQVTGLRHLAWRTAGEDVVGLNQSVVVLKDATPMRESIRG